MKKKFLNYMRKIIIKYYPNYSSDKIDEIMYGIEGIYILVTKTLIIFAIAFFLGILKEMLVLLLTYNFIRLFAFGVHADKGYICLIVSSILFIGATYLCKYTVIPKNVLLAMYIIAITIIAIYSPADTKKRPLIKFHKRIRFKVLSIFVSICYFAISLKINNNLLTNCLIYGLLLECILILPVTYSLFKMPYNNYKNYDLNTK